MRKIEADDARVRKNDALELYWYANAQWWRGNIGAVVRVAIINLCECDLC
ncbi:MAG: hypothetical protein ACTJLM_01565 [Ehrlichia sp.]